MLQVIFRVFHIMIILKKVYFKVSNVFIINKWFYFSSKIIIIEYKIGFVLFFGNDIHIYILLYYYDMYC